MNGSAFMGISSEFFELGGNGEGDPLSPPEGRQPRGASPLDPNERLDFSDQNISVQDLTGCANRIIVPQKGNC